MAWLVLTWKIRRIFQGQFLFEEVRAKTHHSSYTLTLCTLKLKHTCLTTKYYGRSQTYSIPKIHDHSHEYKPS
jgi:hypothetical protein